MKDSPASPVADPNHAKGAAIKNILVPIDFSKLSLQAIPTAKRLAQRFGANVHLVHVQQYSDPGVAFGPTGPIYVSPAIDFEELRKAAEQQLKAVAKEYGLTGTCRAEIGSAPFDLISWMGRQIRADLIVTSTHGRTGFKRAFLGSTAERLVQHAPCPVLITREAKAKKAARGATKSASIMSVDTILVPVDFSDCSVWGLNYAIELAKKFSARIIVLNVVDLRPLLGADGFAVYDFPAAEESAFRDAEKRMSGFVRAVRFGPVRFQSMVIAGVSADTICRVAQTENADLIITATHGRTGLKHVLIGSTAELVVRHATCPVLVVPSHPTVRVAGLTTPKKNVQQAMKSAKLTSRTRIPKTLATRRARKTVRQPLPERRRTNKFRESHAAPRD